MKKLILILILGVVLVGTSVSAAPSSPIKDIRDKVNLSKVQKQETRKERVNRLATNVVNKLVGSVDKIDQLLVRVKDRLTKMETAGKDVSAAKAKIAGAETAIAKAKASVQSLMSSLPSVITASTTPKALRDSTKNAIQVATQEVKAARQAVVEVIKAIKPAKVQK